MFDAHIQDTSSSDFQWAQSLRDTVSLTLFIALSFAGFALIQVAGLS
jgi:hypothetical protein